MTEMAMAPNKREARIYPVAQIIEIHDGDTWRLLIDLGMDGTLKRAWIRLKSVHAEELDKPGGPEARQVAVDVVNTHAPDGWVRLTTFWTPGKLKEIRETMTFVRYEGIITTHNGIALNEVVAGLIPPGGM